MVGVDTVHDEGEFLAGERIGEGSVAVNDAGSTERLEVGGVRQRCGGVDVCEAGELDHWWRQVRERAITDEGVDDPGMEQTCRSRRR